MEKYMTISVAAYNVESFLDQLMQSIVASKALDRIEVIIVNDGSQDGTEQKARYYQEKYPESVRLINKTNGGHGSAINRGIREAKGKYFRTLDGDDWLESEHLRALVERMDDLNADIILSNYSNCYDNGKVEVIDDFPRLIKGKTYTFDELQPLVEWMRNCTVIYRTELLQAHDIQLDEKCFYVDAEYALYPIPYVNTIFYAKEFLYCYRLGRTEQSVSRENRQRLIADGKRVSESLIKYYASVKNQLTECKKLYFAEGIATHCLFHFKSLMMFPASKEKKEEIRSFEIMIRENVPEAYEKMAQRGKRSRMLRFLRTTHYQGYRIMCWYKNRGI